MPFLPIHQMQLCPPRSTIRHLAGSASRRLAASPLHPAARLRPSHHLGECFFFISLVVRLPYSLIFCRFWFFVFKLLLSFFWLCRGGTVCLPMPPSWLEVSEENFNQWSKMITLFLWKNTLVIIQRKENRKDKILPSRREKSIDIAQISKKWQIGYMSLSFQSTLCHFYRQYYQFICRSPLLKCKFSCSRQGVISPYRMS